LDQKNTIGKIIWQQVTTVVILKQNMRQTASTPDDEKMRTALTNMRFAACSKDLQFLQSRTIGNQPSSPTFYRKDLRDVSIITAFNAQKDKINELGSVKFATEHGQDLITFSSEDSIATNAGETERKPKEV
jgi:hypothetical protein